jgi:signal transduction histidine kinase
MEAVTVRGDDRSMFPPKVFAPHARDRFTYVLLGLPLGVAGFAFTAATLGLGAYTAITVVGLPLIGASSLATRRLARVQRRVARSLLQVRIPEPRPLVPQPGIVGWTRSTLKDGVAWRARAYLLLKFPLAVLGCTAAVCLWLLGPYYVTYPVWWKVLHGFTDRPAGSAHPVPVLATPPLFDSVQFLSLPGTFLVSVLGVAVVFAAPWVTDAVIAVDVWLMQRLLGPGLSDRVHDLERTRAQALDGSVNMLRGIERDLHDGTQARLVALSMKLGLAKDKLQGTGTDGGLPDVGRAYELVDTAQHVAQEAMAELRGLVRGIHPPILDAGLEAALASLASGSPVPVERVIDIPERLSQTVETIAYFSAAELLTNVAKHSQARHATLEAVHVPPLLRIRVTDDGKGLARFDPGGGLAGLADRLKAVDGELKVSSPSGGPTVITAEVPCDT